jgi:hypothetical protein
VTSRPRAWALAAWALAGCLATPAARAETQDHFRIGTDALIAGRYDEAIDHFEALADRAPSHPDASYNRGFAYLTRVRAGAERPGDLGRAAAGFAETLAMRPGDDQAEQALELVHAEVARRQARRGRDLVLPRPTLDRVVMKLASERAWAIGAIVSATLLAIGLVLRRQPAGPTRVAGTLLAPAALVATIAFVPLYHGARHLRLTTETGVLVVGEAHLSDESGSALGGEPIHEAALLEVSERRGRLIHVRYGGSEGWVQGAAIHVLRTR